MHPFIYLVIHPSNHLSMHYLSIHPSIYLSIHLFIHPKGIGDHPTSMAFPKPIPFFFPHSHLVFDYFWLQIWCCFKKGLILRVLSWDLLTFETLFWGTQQNVGTGFWDRFCFSGNPTFQKGLWRSWPFFLWGGYPEGSVLSPFSLIETNFWVFILWLGKMGY
jgi:hypothetical protein